MQVPNHVPAPVNLMGSLNQYNAKPITGEETVDVLQRTKDAALRMVADEQNKPTPQGWKTLMTHWVVIYSEAYNVWRRPDIISVAALFDVLISRKKVSSTLYNDIFHKHAVELAKPKSMDSHYIEMYEHHTKLFDEYIAPALTTSLEEALDISGLLVDPIFTRGNGVAIKTAIEANKAVQQAEILRKAKIDYVEQNMRLELQALVIPDPDLFNYLDRDQSPADANASQLTDMFQTKILRGAPNGPHNISLKTSSNAVSPLSKVPQQNQVANYANQATQAIAQGAQDAQQNQQVNQFTQKNKRAPEGNNIINNGKKQKYSQQQGNQQPRQPNANNNKNNNNNNNNNTLKKKFCAFCKNAYPKSKTCDTHLPVRCYRNPQSTCYDAAKAAIKPSN